MNRSFVRIGKWFVKPYEKDEKPINKRYVGTACSAEFLSTLCLPYGSALRVYLYCGNGYFLVFFSHGCPFRHVSCWKAVMWSGAAQAEHCPDRHSVHSFYVWKCAFSSLHTMLEWGVLSSLAITRNKYSYGCRYKIAHGSYQRFPDHGFMCSWSWFRATLKLVKK